MFVMRTQGISVVWPDTSREMLLAWPSVAVALAELGMRAYTTR